MENFDERQGQRQGPARPATRPRKGPARREGAAGRSRQAGSASRVVGDVLRTAYESQVKQLAEAYPTLKTFHDDDGMWLLATSSIIPGLLQEATFLVAVPYQPDIMPRAWAFWTAVATAPRWIGPRHTNFHDGSICAFAPSDNAWSEGGDLRTLLDLYSVWTARQLHLEVFGRWPGKQYSILLPDPKLQAYYRWSQQHDHDDELCGCGSETRRYSECCKAADMKLDLAELMTNFLRQLPGGFSTRRPPPSILAFVAGRSPLPRMADVHLQMQQHPQPSLHR